METQVNDATIEKLIKEICTNLIRANVNPKYVIELREQIRKRIKFEPMQTNTNKARVVQNAVFQSLIGLVDPKKDPYKIEKGKCNVVVFVGLQGCGKTTSICKYAHFYKKKGFKTAIVCADTFRAGAFDQVKQNAEKIKVPYFGSDEADPVQVAREGVAKFRKHDFELILVDTSGRHTQEESLFQEMKNLVQAISPNNIVFVMDAGIGQSAEEHALGFKKAVKVGTIILTKIDGAAKAGGALSSVAATGCPIEFVGTGEKMDDLEKFNPRRFVSKLLGMADLEGLVEKLQDLDVDTEEMTQKLAEGKFTLGDFRSFYAQICSLGPMQNLLKMAPGMKSIDIPDEKKMKKIGYIFDSMCVSELNSCGEPFIKQPNRIKRVSRGSGTTENDVSEILHNFRSMSSVIKKMMGMPGFAEMFGMQPKKQTKRGKQMQLNPDLFKGLSQ